MSMFECSEFSIIKSIKVFSLAVKLIGQNSVLAVSFVLSDSVDLLVLSERALFISFLDQLPFPHSNVPPIHSSVIRIGWEKA